MSIGDEVGKAAAIAAPEIGLSVQAAKVVLWAAGILVALGLAVFLYWKIFLADGQAQQKHDVVKAKVETTMSEAGHQGAQAAIPVITNNYYTQQKSEKTTQENRDAIFKAAGADDPINPAVGDAGRRAICLRPSSARSSVCRALLGPGPGGVVPDGR